MVTLQKFHIQVFFDCSTKPIPFIRNKVLYNKNSLETDESVTQ